jgi:hypothetical protein
MAKAKISPRQKAGSNRGSKIIKLKKDDNQGYKKPGGLLAKHPTRQ